MAVTGLDIYKLLPKTNCKKCGFTTCLSFAMALAQKKTSLDKCPDITASAKAALDSAACPPMATITVGAGDRKLEFGGETVLFRHDKTFFHMAELAILLSDNTSETELEQKIAEIEKTGIERVGRQFRINIVILDNESKAAGVFLKAAKLIKSKYSGNLFLKSASPANLESVLAGEKLEKTVILSAGENNYAEFAGVAQKYGAALAVAAESVEKASEITTKIMASGFNNIFLFPQGRDMRDILHFNTLARRACLKKNNRSLGFPVMNYTGSDISDAATAICKYGSIIVLDSMQIEQVLSLVTLALNIYTDPQKPIMMEPKLYEVGKPGPESPVLVTTNFSLTYFMVQPEIENSRIPAWLIITDSDGMSVLTAWAADKFNPEIIKKAVEKYEVAGKVTKKKIIIPGYAAVMKGKLEEELPGWEIVVGPREAAGIPKYLKAYMAGQSASL